MITLNYKEKEYTVEKGKKVADFIKENLDVDLYTIMACKIDNEVKALSYILRDNCKLDLIDYTTADGSRIYVRGLIFVMTKAFEDLYPEKKIIINYSLGHSLYCETTDGSVISDEEIENVRNKMNEIIEKDTEFVKSELPVEDAKKLYARRNRLDKIGLLENRMKSHVSIYSCGSTVNYFYGVMPISTGFMKYYELIKYENGVLLIYPRRSNPTQIEKIRDTKKLYTTFDEYDKLHKILGVGNISELNSWIKSGNISEVIRISEALHEKKIANIADMIANDKKRKLILIAGPSSSGKTTFAQRLGIQLRVNGITSIALSMDNYFVNREDTPHDENGNYDFECLEAIDLKLFNEQLTALLNGEEVELPTFDFTDGQRKYLGNTAKLKENQVLIVEGIHGLNDKLTASIEREKKFKIYISALTVLNIDYHNRISTTDTRLVRRIVRDNQFRGYSALHTLKMWYSVNRGERKHIFPYQEEADAMFNSSLIYELAVLKDYAVPLLKEIDSSVPEYSEAKRLLNMLSFFESIKTDVIPKTSLLKEFIGGSAFKE